MPVPGNRMGCPESHLSPMPFASEAGAFLGRSSATLAHTWLLSLPQVGLRPTGFNRPLEK